MNEYGYQDCNWKKLSKYWDQIFNKLKQDQKYRLMGKTNTCMIALKIKICVVYVLSIFSNHFKVFFQSKTMVPNIFDVKILF